MRFHDDRHEDVASESPRRESTAGDTSTNSVRSIGNNTKDQILRDFCLPEAPDDIPLNEGQRLVAIGDIHGNYSLLLNILLASHLVDRPNKQEGSSLTLNWIGNDSIVVFVGDLLDKGQEEEKCLRLICRIAQQAKTVGGAVVCLWGNHEAMNTEECFMCVANDQAFSETFSAVFEAHDVENEENENNLDETTERSAKKPKIDPTELRKKVFARGGLLAQAFLSKLKVAVKVGRSVLVHGGLVKRHLDHFGGGIQGIAAMNKAGTEWILSVNQDPPFMDCLDPPEDSWALDMDQGPQWMRDYSKSKELTTNAKGKVDDVLQCLDVDRIIVGHTEQSLLGGVNSTYDAKVWRVDIGTGAQDGHSLDGPRIAFMDDSDFLYNLALEITLNEGKESAQIVRREAKWLHA